MAVPHLRQHADNPVDWWPWCDEAFEAARQLRRRGARVRRVLELPLVSRHGPRVLRGSDDRRALMNESFVNIKVDREKRPDVDALYMAALQAMTGRGGWPLNVFTTPDGRPFYAGTCWPPVRRHGLPAWSRSCAPSPTPGGRAAMTWRPTGSAWWRRWRSRPASAPRAGDRVPDASILEVRRAHCWRRSIPSPRASGPRRSSRRPPRSRSSCGSPHAADASALEAIAASSIDAGGGLVDQLDGGFHRPLRRPLVDGAALRKDALRQRAAPRSADRRGAPDGRRALRGSGALQDGDIPPRDAARLGGAFRTSLDADAADGEAVAYTWSPDEMEAVLEPAGRRARLRGTGWRPPATRRTDAPS
ncbi:MAG: DUF255 domain-containing protein [Anaerolineae bacterium]